MIMRKKIKRKLKKRLTCVIPKMFRNTERKMSDLIIIFTIFLTKQSKTQKARRYWVFAWFVR